MYQIGSIAKNDHIEYSLTVSKHEFLQTPDFEIFFATSSCINDALINDLRVLKNTTTDFKMKLKQYNKTQFNNTLKRKHNSTLLKSIEQITE